MEADYGAEDAADEDGEEREGGVDGGPATDFDELDLEGCEVSVRSQYVAD